MMVVEVTKGHGTGRNWENRVGSAPGVVLGLNKVCPRTWTLPRVGRPDDGMAVELASVPWNHKGSTESMAREAQESSVFRVSGSVGS